MIPSLSSVIGPSSASVVRPSLGSLPLTISLGLAGAALEGAGIGLVIPLLNIMVGGGANVPAPLRLFTDFGAGLSPSLRVPVLGGAILALVLLKNLVVFANALLAASIYGKASHAIRTALSERLTTVGFPFFLKEGPGRLLNILSTESWRTSDALSAQLSIVVNASAMMILLAFLLIISWQLTLAVAFGLGLIQLIQNLLSRRLKRLSLEVAASNGGLAARMLHLIQGARLIRAFGAEAYEQRRLGETSDEVRKLLLVLERRRALLAPALEVMHVLLFLSVMLGAWSAGVSFSVAVAFVVMLYRMQPHVRGIQSALTQVHSLAGSMKEVEWLLDPSRQPAPPSGRIEAFAPQSQIRFDNLVFAYPGASGAEALAGASFTIEAGRATALVGRSGAGKSTVVNLLYRFLEPAGGDIWVDGVRLSEIDPEGWRRRLALASADLELIDGGVAENIAYGCEADLDRIRRAAADADADGFIMALPNGYDTQIGHRGVNLSAGQRQRIGLARALLRDPDLLILDEATNAVDGISERSIVGALRSRSGRKTTLVISHHRRALDFCDHVVVLEEGRASHSLALAEIPDGGIETLYRSAAGC